MRSRVVDQCADRGERVGITWIVERHPLIQEHPAYRAWVEKVNAFEPPRLRAGAAPAEAVWGR